MFRKPNPELHLVGESLDPEAQILNRIRKLQEAKRLGPNNAGNLRVIVDLFFPADLGDQDPVNAMLGWAVENGFLSDEDAGHYRKMFTTNLEAADAA